MPTQTTVLLSTAYLAPVEYYTKLRQWMTI